MLGTLWFSLRRTRGASIASITAVAVCVAVACGSDDGPSGPREGEGGERASGGARPSSGGSDSSGSGGDAPVDVPTDGGSGPSTPGDFSSVWQAESAEMMFFDPQNPAGLETHTLDIPAKVEGPGDGREVELYLRFEGEQLITYAYSDGDPVYYRFSRPAIAADDFYSVSSDEALHSYTIEDGKLLDTAQQSFGAVWGAFTTTTYRKVDGEFPPNDWPDQVVSYELGGAE